MKYVKISQNLFKYWNANNKGVILFYSNFAPLFYWLSLRSYAYICITVEFSLVEDGHAKAYKWKLKANE